MNLFPNLILNMISFYLWRLRFNDINRVYRMRTTVVNKMVYMSISSIELGRRVQVYQYRNMITLNPSDLYIYCYKPRCKGKIDIISRKVARVPKNFYYSNGSRPEP